MLNRHLACTLWQFQLQTLGDMCITIQMHPEWLPSGFFLKRAQPHPQDDNKRSHYNDTWIQPALLALGLFLPSLFFLCAFFWFCFFLEGLVAVNIGQVNSPQAAVFLDSFLIYLIAVLYIDPDNFIMKWITRGSLCQFILPNPNPK